MFLLVECLLQPVRKLSDLAVEVLSPGNTQGEMERKVADYLGAGAGLVWIVDPATRTAVVHSAGGSGNASSAVIAATGELHGEEALPGFELKIATIFRRRAADAGRSGVLPAGIF